MIEAVKLEADIYPAGPRGLSAYEIYKKEGGQLSEEEWLKSLNGLTPTIGENGNWFLGTVDTGLPSRGPKGDTGSIKFIVVTELPTENIDETAIYMKPVEKPTGENNFEELIYVNGKWEDLGTPNVAVDLSNYYTKEETDVITGDLENLITENKDNLVEAINEVMGGEIPQLNIGNAVALTEPSSYTRSDVAPLLAQAISRVTKNYTQKGCLILYGYQELGIFKISASGTSGSNRVVSMSGTTYMLQDSLSYSSFNFVYFSLEIPTDENKVVRCRRTGLYKYDPDKLLTDNNTRQYTPTADYHPATKKYVDDNVKTYTAGDNIAISEDNVISSNIGLPVLENQEINIHTFPVGSYIITGKDTVIKYGMNGASSYKPITTNSSTGNTDTWVLNITHDTGTENNRGYAFLFRKYGSSGAAALYTFDFSGMNYIDITQLMERNVNQSIYGRFDFYHALPISSLVPSSDRELTNKKYVDDTIKTHYENMTGYDATKTQVLKNINGTLTWVDEV